jgi:wobble nucleotide-excising tRNase
MISRFTKIKGIGKFQDCLNIGGRHFSKNTLIFGKNTEGKSTLTDILLSFKTGDAAILEGRKTFGFTSSQQIEFFDDNNNPFRFPSAEWSNGFNDIEIFDTQFINQNIFEGNEITYGHQKNLHSIIIGHEGKKLANEINALQEELSKLTKLKTAKTSEFNRIFKKDISVKDFANLPKIEKVDDKIKEFKSKIETANNQSKIKNVFENIETLLNNIINQKTKTILSKSIQIKADIVTEHILKTWKNPNHSKDFLQTGLNLTKEEQRDCVFCGQELRSNNTKELLTAYSQFFSQEYRTLQVEISNAISKFEKWDTIAFLESIQDKLASVKLALNLTEKYEEEIRELKKVINAEFAIKKNDIGYEIDFEKYDLLIEIIKKVKTQVDVLKQQNVFTTEVDVALLNGRIKHFEFSKTRHIEEWDDFFEEYDDIDIIQEKKKQRREIVREQLNDYSKNLFLIHYDTINKILQEMNADFIICDLKPIKKLVGKSERVFALEFFNSHRVSIDETATNKPNFKNTLSESDKRVLAFAFFYSLMIHDTNLSKKIIVFDDPFSSFDSDRRIKTVQLLANPHLITSDGEIVEKSVNQLIVLTHEAEFFKWLYKKLDSPRTLKIIPDGIINGVKKSTFSDCNVEKEFLEDNITKYLNEIQSILSENRTISNYEELFVKCRKILENIFTKKYLFELEDEINKRKSIRSFVEKLIELEINEFNKPVKQTQFIDLCDNLNIELHDNGLTNDGGNALSVLSDFLKLVKQV